MHFFLENISIFLFCLFVIVLLVNIFILPKRARIRDWVSMFIIAVSLISSLIYAFLGSVDEIVIFILMALFSLYQLWDSRSYRRLETDLVIASDDKLTSAKEDNHLSYFKRDGILYEMKEVVYRDIHEFRKKRPPSPCEIFASFRFLVNQKKGETCIPETCEPRLSAMCLFFYEKRKDNFSGMTDRLKDTLIDYIPFMDDFYKWEKVFRGLMNTGKCCCCLNPVAVGEFSSIHLEQTKGNLCLKQMTRKERKCIRALVKDFLVIENNLKRKLSKL